MTHPFSGIYCITGLPFAPNNAVATIGSDGGAIGVFLELGAQFNCPGGTQISVETFTVTVTNTQVSSFDGTDNGFYINVN